MDPMRPEAPGRVRTTIPRPGLMQLSNGETASGTGPLLPHAYGLCRDASVIVAAKPRSRGCEPWWYSRLQGWFQAPGTDRRGLET
jgi:hypothetical protein